MPLSPTSDFALGALNWVERNLSFFAPSREELSPTDRDLQAMAELAVATRLCERNKTDIPSPTINRVRSFLTMLAEDSYLWHRAVRFPGEFIPICDLVAATSGPDASPQLHALQQIISCGALDGVDRTLVSQLELRLSSEWAGLQCDSPDLDEISRRCPKPPLPMFASNDDCYTLTHMIIFATDFGNRPAPSSGGLSDRSYLGRILSSYIMRYISEGNLDLLIELLLSWQYLCLPQTVLTHQAWRFFVGHQSPDGSFHRLAANGKNAPELSLAPAPDRAWFSQRYHTTLLAIIAGASPDIQPAQPRVSSAALDTKIGKRPCVVADDVIESARVSVEAAWRWVSNEADAPACDESLETVGYSLLTWWVWRALVGRADIYLDSPPENLLRRSRAFDLGSYYLVGRGSLTLNIITAGLVRRFDADNTDANAFLEHMSSIVAKSNPEDGCERLALCEKKVILRALGFEHHPHVSDYVEVISAAEQCVISASPDRIGDLLVRIESLTGYGMRDVDIEAGDLWLRDILQGLADDAFRKYDWPLACRCVRALGYLNLISHDTSLDYMAFFVLHQLPSGTFGYLGPDSKVLLSGSSDYRSIDQVNLSIAVEALWTIAELATGGGWKLFESLSEARVNRLGGA